MQAAAIGALFSVTTAINFLALQSLGFALVFLCGELWIRRQKRKS